jgi:4-hydroxy 2-oxovalerate aldolase
MVKILDCTIRDGGYVNNWNFSKKFVKELYNVLNESEIDYMEVGFRNDNAEYNDTYNIWRTCKEKDLLFLKKKKLKLCVMCDNSKFNINKFDKSSKSIIDMVRIAFHKNEIDKAITNCIDLKKLNYNVSLNAMGTILYNDDELYKLCKSYLDSNCDYLYIADSYGSMSTKDIYIIKEKIIKNCLEIDPLKKIKLGFHAHNNLQNGISNVMYCINNKFDIVDTTVLGMGRGAGNAPTEILLSKLNKEIYPILNFVNINMKLKLMSNKWGYNIPYFISGHLDCHPTYITKILEYGIMDYIEMWEIINVVVSKNKHNKFDKNYLDKIIKNLNN